MRPLPRLESPPRGVDVLSARTGISDARRPPARRWRISLFWQIGSGYVIAIVCFFLIHYAVGLLAVGPVAAMALKLLLMSAVAMGLAVFTSKLTDKLKTLNRYALQISRGDLSRPLAL